MVVSASRFYLKVTWWQLAGINHTEIAQFIAIGCWHPIQQPHDTDVVQPDIRESPKLCCLASRHNHKHKFPSTTGMAKASNCKIPSSQGSRGSCYCGLDMTSFVGGFGFRIPGYTMSQPRKRYVLMLPSGDQQAASSVLYTTICKHSLVLLRMGEIIARNMLSWLKLLIKLLLLHLVGCLYYCIEIVYVRGVSKR